LVIWETGLGGRLDATNIVTPLASVITNIALDHQQWLGDTLEKIAAEKAGIIKPGIPVITATDEPSALTVIEKIAREKNAPIIVVGQASRLSLIKKEKSETGATPVLPLSGEHQKLNAALALAAVQVLQEKIPVSEEKIREGLQNVNWPGRFQLIEKPDGQKYLLDGAHNVAGAEALRAALEKDFAGARPVFIFGALADKNWPDICKILAPLAAKIFTVPVASERTAEARELAKNSRSANPAAAVAAFENLDEAMIACKNERFIVVTGSLYLVGEALERLGLSPGKTGERGLNEWPAKKIYDKNAAS
jgi:dihydrofolate synthase/folylpolyglutamate synthase